jgi:hypothetical protein
VYNLTIMLRGPNGAQRVEEAAAGYLASTAEALGLTDASQLPAEQATALNLGQMAARAAQAVVGTRQLLEANEMALNTLFGSFVPAVIEARAAAHDIALTQGQFTPTDETSLTNAGSGLEQLGEYLAPFKLQGEASLPGNVPPISIGTLLRLKGMGANGRDGYLSSLHNMYSVVEYGTEWPSFANNFSVPVLVDPTTYSIEEFANMPTESADGYAQQVVDTWRSIQESEKDHPSFTGQPLIVRAVAVLPVPPAEGPDADKFAVDFLPQLGKTQADIDGQVKRAYDVRLLVKGNANIGANYVKFDWQGQQPVYTDSEGKRAPLTVQRGTTIDEELPTSVDDLGLTPRSQGTVALYIAPHAIKEQPRVPAHSGYEDGGGLMFGRATKGGTTRGLGAASVGVGPASSWIGSDRQTEGYFDRVAPELQGRPIIVSLQLLTFER